MLTFFLIVVAMNVTLGYALAVLFAPEYNPPAVANVQHPAEPIAPSPLAVAAEQLRFEPLPADAGPAAAAIATPAAPVAEEAIPAIAEPEVVESMIEDFKSELSNYRDELAKLDHRMRLGAEAQDAQAMKLCLNDLRTANESYMGQQGQAANLLQEHCTALDMQIIGQQLEGALYKQGAQVKTANCQLESLDLEENLLVGCQQLLDETSRLVDANHALRETLDDVELQLGRRRELTLNPADPPADPLNNLVSRVQFEAAMADWWRDDPQRLNPLSIGLIDVDRMRDVNELHSVQTGDRILDSLAQTVGAAVTGTQLAARMSGQRFLLMLPHLPGRDGSNLIEQIRQQVEATRFEHPNGPIKMTVSGAVAEAMPSDSAAVLFERLEGVMREAKRSGRNRTYLQEEKFAAPVLPPTLKPAPRSIKVA